MGKYQLFDFKVKFVAIKGMAKKDYETNVPATDAKAAPILAAHKLRIDRFKYSISTLQLKKCIGG